MHLKSPIDRLREGHRIWKRGFTEMQRGNNIIIKAVHDKVLSDISKIGAKSVLDVGCGDARLLARLSRSSAFSGSRLYGMDKEIKEVVKARRRTGKRVKFVLGAVEKMPRTRKFDLILTTNSFHEWEDQRSGVSNLLKRLSAHGTLIIFDTWPLDTGALKAKYSGFACKVRVQGPLVRASFTRVHA